MRILIAIIVEISVVLAIEEHADYGNITTAHAVTDFRQKIPSQLDEVIREKSNMTKENEYESKGGTLQKILASVSFICKGRFEGYYSDVDFGCQIFHYCKQNGIRFTFVCPAKSIFNQKEMTCDHNVSDPKSFCDESPKYYYLNSVLYAQRKDVSYSVTNSNSSEQKSENPNKSSDTTSDTSSDTASHTTTKLSTIQPVAPTVILPINTTKLTTVAVRPFWGFNSIHPKNNLISKESQKASLMSTISPSIEQTVSPTEALKNKSNSYSHQLLVLTQNPQNLTSNYWFAIKDKNYNNGLIKPIHSTQTKWLSSLEPTNSVSETSTGSSSHTDWDDLETGKKLYESNFEQFRPTFKEPPTPSKTLTSSNTALLPAFPMQPLPSGPMVVLRPPHTPGTLPIATLYKQTKYVFGKPLTVHKGLYQNPFFGASILNPHSLIGSVPPIGLQVSASENTYTSAAPNQNQNILSNLQNAFKLPFGDILGLKFNLNQVTSKQKRSDFPDAFSYKTTTTHQKPVHESSAPSPSWHSTNKMPLYSSLINHNQRSSNNLLNPVNREAYFPVKFDNSSSINKNFVHFKSPELVTTSSPLLNTTPKSPPKYSLRMEDVVKVKNLMRPSIFYAISDNQIRKKWFETYAKIKQTYTGKQPKYNDHISLTIPNIANRTNLQIANITQLLNAQNIVYF